MPLSVIILNLVYFKRSHFTKHLHSSKTTNARNNNSIIPTDKNWRGITKPSIKLQKMAINIYLLRQKLILGICLLLFTSIAYGQTNADLLQKKVQLNLKEATTLEVIHKIQKEAQVNFAFNLKNLDTQTLFSFPKKKLSIADILKELFVQSPLTYKVVGTQIVLYKSEVKTMSFRVNKPPQKTKDVILSGYLYDAATGEAMIAASIYEKSSFIATTSNNFGFFSLALPAGEHTIIVSFLGYETKEIKVNRTQQITIQLQAITNELTEIVVSATNAKEVTENAIQSAQIGVMRIAPKKLKAIPALAGEADVLKAITLLPGVKPGLDGAAGFYVRGGSTDQNLILLDGVPMYNPYHLFGFLSTFNPDAINNIEITKGAFPARYGGRLSSVLDITTKDGNNQTWKKKVSAGLLSAKFSLNGPLIKDRSSISIAARRTLLDFIITPIIAQRDQGFKATATYNFGDINLKYNYKISNKDKLYVSGFYSRDALKFREKSKEQDFATQKLTDREGWQNGMGSFRWNHLFNDKLFLNTTAYISNYDYFSKQKKEVVSQDESLIASSVQETEYHSIINDLAIKQDYHYFLNPKHTIRFGGSVIFHKFQPGVNSLYQKTGDEVLRGNSVDNTTKAKEFDLYVEDNMAIGKRLKVNLGVHASAFSVEDTSYTSIQPRLSARFLLTENWSIKGGYAQMAQYLHLLTSSSLSKSSDLWVPVTTKITPPTSTQYSLGTAFNIGQYGIEIEGYYKEMNQLIDYKEGAEFSVSNNQWEEKVESGVGKSYGAEIFLQKKKGQLTGWIGYTLSWTNRQFANINAGTTFPFKYDRRHDISIVANYEFNDKWAFNGTWVFFSGTFATVPTASHLNPNFRHDDRFAWFQFPTEGGSIFNITDKNPGINQTTSQRNNYRLPDYHRLDLTAVRKVNTKRGNYAEWTVGLTNAYNKFNPSFFSSEVQLNPSTDNPDEVKSSVNAFSIFPMMPTINYMLEF